MLERAEAGEGGFIFEDEDGKLGFECIGCVYVCVPPEAMCKLSIVEDSVSY